MRTVIIQDELEIAEVYPKAVSLPKEVRRKRFMKRYRQQCERSKNINMGQEVDNE